MNSEYISFFELSKKYRENTFLLASGVNLSYEQLHVQICHFVSLLRKSGIKKHHRVAILSTTNIHYPLLLLSLFQIGAVAIPLNTSIPEKQIVTYLKNLTCDWLLVSKEYKNSGLAKEVSLIEFERLISNNARIRAELIKNAIPLVNEATVIFTSGSSNGPKAVLHTIGNHYYSALGSNINIPLTQSDRWLLSLPLYHVSGLSILFRTLIVGAAAVIPDEGLSLLKNIILHRVTHISLVTTQLLHLLDDGKNIAVLKGLKAILLGGSAIPLNLIEKAIASKLPIHISYGSTEMASQITTTQAGDAKTRLNASGRVLKYRELKLTADGEILVKGATLFKGYLYKDRISHSLNNEGWFNTGDLGRLDKHGYLYVTGRKDNMFISGGENIYPEEIEKYLLQFKGVLEAIVVDIPDETFGARPVAFLKMKQGVVVNKNELEKYLLLRIPKFKLPVNYLNWPDNIINMKPSRKVFRELALAQLLKHGKGN